MTNGRLIVAGTVLLGVLMPGPIGSARLMAVNQVWSNEDAWTLDALEGRTTANLLATAKHLQDVLLRYPALAPYGREDLRNTNAQVPWSAHIEQCGVYLDRVHAVLKGRGVRAPGVFALSNATASLASGSSLLTPLAVTLDSRDLDRCAIDGVTLADCAIGFLTAGTWVVPSGQAVPVLDPDGAFVGSVFAVDSSAGPIALALSQAGTHDDRLRQQKANADRVTPARMDDLVATFTRRLKESRAPDDQAKAVEQAVERVRTLVVRVEQVFRDFSRENETTRRASVACKDVDQLPATNAAKAEHVLPQMKPVSAAVVASLTDARRLTTPCRTPDDGRRATALHEKARSDYWDLDDLSRVARSHLLAIQRFYADLKAAHASRAVAAGHMALLQRLIDEELAGEIDRARRAVAAYRESLDRHASAVGRLLQEATNLRGAFTLDHEAPAHLAAGFTRIDDAFAAEEADVLAESRVAAIDGALNTDNERVLGLRRVAQGRLDDLGACGQMGAGDMPEAVGRDVKRIETELAATYRAASQAFADAKDLPEKASACGSGLARLHRSRYLAYTARAARWTVQRSASAAANNPAVMPAAQ